MGVVSLKNKEVGSLRLQEHFCILLHFYRRSGERSAYRTIRATRRLELMQSGCKELLLGLESRKGGDCLPQNFGRLMQAVYSREARETLTAAVVAGNVALHKRGVDEVFSDPVSTDRI